MWSDVDFLRKEVARIEAALVGRNANSYDGDELWYDLANLLEELKDVEFELWTKLDRSAS